MQNAFPDAPEVRFLIGVDGGGSGCRVALARTDGTEIARAQVGPAALALGVEAAWQAISQAIGLAFSKAGQVFWSPADCAIGVGLSGGFVPAWRAQFMAQDPGFAALRLENDGFAALMGAHGGAPGAMIAVGTGIVGEAWYGGADTRMVSGWGYPVGDEGSGAWLGLQAARLAHRALDGRGPRGPLANAVIQRFGGDLSGASAWLATANQTAYASLAPLVLMHAQDDAAARRLLIAAGEEIATIAATLDPQAQWPLALVGGLSEPLKPWLPEALRSRIVPPQADAVSGALLMARQMVAA